MKYFYFPRPETLPASAFHFQPDSLPAPIVGQPDTHSSGRHGVSFTIPDGVPDQNGANLTGPPTWSPKLIRGRLVLNGDDCQLLVDDVTYTEDKVCPDPVPPIPPQPPLAKDPFGIIKAVYAGGHYDLSTKAGCGTFNEDCVTALHTAHSTKWGHIQKFPPQNHWPEEPYVPGGKVHAVDANMLLTDAPDGTKAGIYDIVFDSESPNAQPAFNFKGAPDPLLWYYPAK
jgi:hypothetical protein